MIGWCPQNSGMSPLSEWISCLPGNSVDPPWYTPYELNMTLWIECWLFQPSLFHHFWPVWLESHPWHPDFDKWQSLHQRTNCDNPHRPQSSFNLAPYSRKYPESMRLGKWVARKPWKNQCKNLTCFTKRNRVLSLDCARNDWDQLKIPKCDMQLVNKEKKKIRACSTERPKGLNVNLPILSRSIVWQGQGNNEPQQQELQLSCQESSESSTRSVSFRQELPVQCLEGGANGNLLQLDSKIYENYRKFIKAVKLIMSAVQLFLPWHRQVTSRPAIQILSVHLLLSHFAFPFEVPWPRSHHKSAVTPHHVYVRAAYPHLSATSCAMRLETVWTFKNESDYSKGTLTAATARIV